MNDFPLPAVPPPPAFTVVAVQGSWFSKINWTQAVAMAAMLLAFFTGNKLQIDPSQQTAIVVVVGLVGQIVTVILKTYFTSTITPQSVSGSVNTVNAVVLPQMLPIGTAVPLASGGVAKVVG